MMKIYFHAEENLFSRRGKFIFTKMKTLKIFIHPFFS